MESMPGEITAKHVDPLKIKRYEFEKRSFKLTVSQSFKIHLGWTGNKIPYNQQGDENSLYSLPNESRRRI